MYSLNHTPTNRICRVERYNIMKKLLTVILTIVLLSVYLVLPLSATGIVSAKQSFINDEITKYMRVVMPNTSSVSVSNIFPIYDSTTGAQTNEAVFVISNNKVIGMMLIATVDGQYHSTYYDGVDESIQDAYADGTGVALVADEECMLFITNTQTILLLSGPCNYNLDLFDFSDITIVYNHISIEHVISIITPRSAVLERSCTIPVTHVSNSNGANGEGLCWAAALAICINYLKGYSGNNALTADSLYQLCLQNWRVGEAAPAGIPYWYQKAYGFFAIQCTVTEYQAYNYYSLYNYIGTYKPLIFGVYRYEYNAETEITEKIGHAVVLCGITVYRDGNDVYGTYAFCDPNVSTNNVYVNVDYSTLMNGTSFTYYNGQRMYTEWSRTVLPINI